MEKPAYDTQTSLDADRLAVGVAQGGGVEGRGDHLATCAPWVESGVAGDAALHDLPEGRQELPSFIGRDDARERLLNQLVRTKAEEREDGVVGLQDLPLEVGNEDRVRRVGDDDAGIQRAARFDRPGITLDHARLRTEFQPCSHFGPPSRTARRRNRLPPGPRRRSTILAAGREASMDLQPRPPNSSFFHDGLAADGATHVATRGPGVYSRPVFHIFEDALIRPGSSPAPVRPLERRNHRGPFTGDPMAAGRRDYPRAPKYSAVEEPVKPEVAARSCGPKLRQREVGAFSELQVV